MIACCGLDCHTCEIGQAAKDPALAEKLARIQRLSQEMGCTSPDIRTTISILCTGAIPYFRICESGLFNLRTNSMVSLIVEE